MQVHVLPWCDHMGDDNDGFELPNSSCTHVEDLVVIDGIPNIIFIIKLILLTNVNK